MRICLPVVLLLCLPTTLFSQSAFQSLRNKAKQTMQQVESTPDPASSNSATSTSTPNSTSVTQTAQPTAAPSQGQDGAVRYEYCTIFNNGTSDKFFSAVFATNRPNDGTIDEAFAEYVKAKYSQAGHVFCNRHSKILDETQAEAAMAEEQRSSSGEKIVRTGWTFDPSAPTPTTNSASIASPVTDSASTPNPVTNSASATQTGGCAPHSRGHDLASGRRAPLLTPEQEVDKSKQFCSANDILSGLYDCSCFAQHMLAYRQQHGMCTPFINVVQPVTLDPHFSECVGNSAQVTAYGDKRAQAFLRSNPQYASRTESLSKCASDGFARLFLAKPVENTVYINGYFTTAISRCVENGH